jgi:glycosyltransferase-like protein LARGE
MALPKTVLIIGAVYLIFSVLYTSTYILGFKGSNKASVTVANLQKHYLGKQLVSWSRSTGK